MFGPFRAGLKCNPFSYELKPILMQPKTREQPIEKPTGVWEKHLMALDDVTDRLQRITAAFSRASVPFALVGGQAVAMWVASKDPAAVRTTKDVDILLNRADLLGVTGKL